MPTMSPIKWQMISMLIFTTINLVLDENIDMKHEFLLTCKVYCQNIQNYFHWQRDASMKRS